MRTSNIFLLGAAQAIFCAPLLLADVATFNQGSTKLSGELLSIGEDGVIEWKSLFSSEPLKLKSSKMDSVVFTDEDTAKENFPIRIALRNGDSIPANEALRFTEEGLQIQSTAVGVINIPRHALSSAQFGIHDSKAIYHGPSSIKEWTEGPGSQEGWSMRGDKALSSSAPSIAAQKFDLPQNFTLSFNLKWSKRPPNISVTLADPLLNQSTPASRYRYHMNNSGMRIVREKGGKARHNTLAQWRRPATNYKDNSVAVEIHVDRDRQRLELFVNGESEGLIADPMDGFPTGSGITFTCHTNSGGSQIISDIKIAELSNFRQRHLAENRGPDDHDSMITVDDDRWSGDLQSISQSPNGSAMIFKTTFDSQAWEIPQSEISTLFFAETADDVMNAESPRFIIELQNEGRLKVSNCLLSKDGIHAIHPLLGALNIPRNKVLSIKNIDSK